MTTDIEPAVWDEAADQALKDRLLGPRGASESGMPEEDYPIPGVGTIRIRGLSRKEAHQVSAAKGTEERDIAMLKAGMVRPKMNRGDIMFWQANGLAGEINKILKKITYLSGMGDEELPKEIYKSLREELGV